MFTLNRKLPAEVSQHMLPSDRVKLPAVFVTPLEAHYCRDTWEHLSSLKPREKKSPTGLIKNASPRGHGAFISASFFFRCRSNCVIDAASRYLDTSKHGVENSGPEFYLFRIRRTNELGSHNRIRRSFQSIFQQCFGTLWLAHESRLR